MSTDITQNPGPRAAAELLAHMESYPQKFSQFAAAIIGLDRYTEAVTRLVARDGLGIAQRCTLGHCQPL